MKQTEEEKEYRNQISKTQITLLISVAILFDIVVFIIGLVDFIPYVGTSISFYLSFIINTYANLTFLTWFFLLGVGLFKPSRLMTMWSMYFLSFVPFLKLLPFWVVAVILMIISARIKTYIKTDLVKQYT
jgi:hypothetical protein